MKRGAFSFVGIGVCAAAAAVVVGLGPSSAPRADAARGVAAASSADSFASYVLADPATKGRDGAVDAARPLCRPYVAAWTSSSGKTVVDVRAGATYGLTVMVEHDGGRTAALNGPATSGVQVERFTFPVAPSRVQKVVAYALDGPAASGGGCTVRRS
jgi:hypothetical protein